MTNVTLNEGFTQVCVWPGTMLGDSTVEALQSYMEHNFGTRVQFLEEITTSPDLDWAGRPVHGTGGRVDMLFAVHEEDILKFALKRLNYGIRWIEDVYYNGNGDVYPARVSDYRSW